MELGIITKLSKDVVQAVEYLPSKHEALSSNPNNFKTETKF
jgi:hypothetical protein